MPLRDKAFRRTAERALHLMAVGALLLAGWLAWRAPEVDPSTVATDRQIAQVLIRWSTAEVPRQAHLSFSETPPPEHRDWIAALRGAGTPVTWEGDALTPSALVVEPVIDPKRSWRISVAAAPEAEVQISDDLGVLDRVPARATGAGAVVSVPDAQGHVRARVGSSEATAIVPASPPVKPVLLLGAAGWESKFVMAALEEHGWTVDARVHLSPKAVVVQGSGAVKIDVERYSAVIALDASASRHATAIDAYVRQGGGLIAAGDGARLPAFSALLGGRAGPLSPGKPFTAEKEVVASPRARLALSPLVQAKSDAVALETRPNGDVAALARRVGQGRVVQVGYDETWRWRMQGADADPVSGHREWWSAMVSSVASGPEPEASVDWFTDPTPLASLIETLGPPAPQRTPSSRSDAGPHASYWLSVAAVIALLLEWLSRRLRGVP